MREQNALRFWDMNRGMKVVEPSFNQIKNRSGGDLTIICGPQSKWCPHGYWEGGTDETDERQHQIEHNDRNSNIEN
jgi:hypothetical protein